MPALEQVPEKEALPLLHVHSFYSLISKIPAVSSPEEIMWLGRDLGYTRIAVTDLSFYGLGRAAEAAKNHGVEPIAGIELPFMVSPAERPSSVTLLARNGPGLREIFRLASWVNLRNRELVESDVAGHDNVYALVRHPLAADLLTYPNVFYALDSSQNRKIDTPLWREKTVVTPEIRQIIRTETPYLQFFTRLLEDQYLPDWQAEGYTLSAPQTIEAAYAHFPGAVERTKALARGCRLELPAYPKIQLRPEVLPPGKDPDERLRELVFAGLSKKPNWQELVPRAESELAVIKERDGARYFLFCAGEIISYARSIPTVDLAVGSAVNGLVTECLGISFIDTRDLDSDRFLNRERYDQADVDIQFPYNTRDLVLKHVLDNYPQAARIAVVSKWDTRGLKQSVRRYDAQHPKNPIAAPEKLIIQLAQLGAPASVSTHPTAITFVDWARGVSGPNVILQLDKDDIKKHYRDLKLDLISKVNQFVLAESLRLANEKVQEPEFPPDRKVFNRIFSGRTVGVTDLESPHLINVLRDMGRRLKEPGMTHIAQALALARPAGGARERYFRYMATGEARFSRYPDLAQIIRGTNFTVIFQEQVMQIATKVAGLDRSFADKLRKMMSSKVSENERRELLGTLDKRLAERGYPADITKEIEEQVACFADYGFVDGHARALGKRSYDLAYMAEHHPNEFWTAVLTSLCDKPPENGGRNYPRFEYINAALRDGVKFSFPPVEALQSYPRLIDGQIEVGYKLFPLQRGLGEKYTEFTGLLKSGISSERLVAWQIKNFELSLTDQTTSLLRPDYFFDPKKTFQIIAGHEVIRRPIDPTGESTRDWFLTLDSGSLVNLHLPYPLATRSGNAARGPFWAVTVDVKYPGSGVKEIVDILPVSKVLKTWR